MAERDRVVDGELEIADTPDARITRMTRREVVGKIAEKQTVVDHKTLDLAEAQLEVDRWTTRLGNVDRG